MEYYVISAEVFFFFEVYFSFLLSLSHITEVHTLHTVQNLRATLIFWQG